MSKYVGALVALAVVVGLAATGAGGAAQGQSNDAFAASYANLHVRSVSATTLRTSCYRPEVYYDGRLPDDADGARAHVARAARALLAGGR